MKALYRQNESGFSLPITIFAMMAMGYLGMTMVQNSAGSFTMSNNEIQSAQATYAAQAGAEATIFKLNNGTFPDSVLNFGSGSTATIVTNPVLGTITSTGAVGVARKAMTVTLDPLAFSDGTPGAGYRSKTGFANQCLHIDASSAYLDGVNLRALKLVKTCNAAVRMIPNSISIDWNLGNWAVDNAHDGDIDDDGIKDADDPVDCGAGKFLVCHNDNRPHTICISASGWANGHLSGTGGHASDYLGSCPSDSETIASSAPSEGLAHLTKIYLDDLVGIQDNTDQLFAGDVTSGVYVGGARNFIQNVDYNFGPTLTNEAIVFSEDMGARVTFTVNIRFEDGSQADPTIFVAYHP